MDHLVAAEGAKLSMRFVKVGVVPELGSSQLVPICIRFGRSSDLMLIGRTVLADEAAAMGLVDGVVPADSLMDSARDMAHAMGENPQSTRKPSPHSSTSASPTSEPPASSTERGQHRHRHLGMPAI